MYSLHIIWLEINFGLICYLEQDFSHYHLRRLCLLLRHKQEYFLFLCIVIIYQVKRQSDLFSEPSHCVAVLFLFQADSTCCHVQLSWFVFHLVLSLSSFLITFMMASPNWLKITWGSTAGRSFAILM